MEEGVEQAQHITRRDPHPGVPDTELQIEIIDSRLEDNAAGIGKLDGVAQQVREHLLNTHDVAADLRRDIGLDKAVQGQTFTHHQRQIVADDVRDHLARDEAPRLDLQLLRLDLGEVEDVIDDLQQ